MEQYRALKSKLMIMIFFAIGLTKTISFLFRALLTNLIYFAILTVRIDFVLA